MFGYRGKTSEDSRTKFFKICLENERFSLRIASLHDCQLNLRHFHLDDYSQYLPGRTEKLSIKISYRSSQDCNRGKVQSKVTSLKRFFFKSSSIEARRLTLL